MDRLSLLISLLTGAVLTGGIAIAAFSLGYYGWLPVIIAAVIGFGLSWPAAYFISRRVKRQDPNFNHRNAEPEAVPDPSSREV